MQLSWFSVHTVTTRIWSTYTAINYDINYTYLYIYNIYTEQNSAHLLTHGAQCDDMCGGGPGVIIVTAPVILDNCLICVNSWHGHNAGICCNNIRARYIHWNRDSVLSNIECFFLFKLSKAFLYFTPPVPGEGFIELGLGVLCKSCYYCKLIRINTRDLY